MQYRFADGRAAKRSDDSLNSLKAFLDNNAAHEGCPARLPAYGRVIAYTKDETQVFIKYGCGAADSPAYAVQVNGIWRMLSPTNHFDYLGIPDCRYLAMNNISREIAPVCANEVRGGTPAGIPEYSVQ